MKIINLYFELNCGEGNLIMFDECMDDLVLFFIVIKIIGCDVLMFYESCYGLFILLFWEIF